MRQGGVPRALPDNKDESKSAPGLTEDEVPWELQESNVSACVPYRHPLS